MAKNTSSKSIKTSDLVNLLVEISNSFKEETDLQKILQITADSTSSVAEFESAAIYLLNGKELRLSVTTPKLPPDIPDFILKTKLDSHSHIKKAIEKNTVLNIDDILNEQLSKEEQVVVQTRNLRTVIYVPIIHEKNVLGVLILGSVDKPKTIDKDKIEMCKAIANNCAIALVNKELIQKNNDIIANLKEANTIINRSSAVAFLWKNEKGWPVEFVSENVKKLFGYSVNEFHSKKINYSETIHRDDIENVNREVNLYSKQLNKHSFIHKPYRIITKKGDIRWVTDTTYIRREASGKITHYEGIVNDITEQHELQKALSESKEKFTKLFHTSPSVITISNIGDGTIIDINDKGLVELGYKRDEIIGKTSIELELVSLESRNKILKLLKENGSYSNIELEVKQKSGEMRYGLFNGQIISLAGKNFVFQTIADISKIKQAEKALVESEEKLRKINSEQSAINLLSSKINKSLDLYEVIKTSVKLLKQTIKSDLAFIFQRDGDNLILKGVDSTKSKKILGDIPIHKVGECMCGLSVSLKKALYSKNIFKDLRCTWDECKEAGLKSFAALPLFKGEDVIGVVGLAKFEEHDFEKDSTFLEVISATISIGFANALLHTETINAQYVITKQSTEITSLYKKTIEMQEAERRHIALELHDHLGQNITGIQLKLKEMRSVVNKNESAEQSRLINESLDLIEKLDKLTHQMTYELRPPMLDELGLRSALEWYLNNLEANTNIKCELNMHGLKRSYAADINTAVFRILQEILNNVKKHSKASKVKIDFQDKNGIINLAIKDDGIGFDLKKVYDNIYKSGRVGILGIRERVKMVGGQIKIDSKPKTGTTTLITIPTK